MTKRQLKGIALLPLAVAVGVKDLAMAVVASVAMRLMSEDARRVFISQVVRVEVKKMVSERLQAGLGQNNVRIDGDDVPPAGGDRV